MGGFAWVTLATNDSYSLGALVLAHSLKQVGTAHQLAVLVTPGVTSAMREKLSSVFNVVQEVNILDSRDQENLRLLKRPELGITFTKLHCWKLTQFEKCVFLDADTLVLQNSDELFEREELSAAPDVGWPDCFNSGVFVYRPSLDTYEKLIQFAIEKGSFDGGDQGLLNLYFSDWAHKDISKHLPFIYNMCSTACYSYLPAFKQYGANAKIIHFIGAQKPWLQYFNTETRKVQPSGDSSHLQEVLQRWWDIFCSLIHPHLSPAMAGLAGAFSQLTLGVPRTVEQDALENVLRKQAWEVGNIDYLGKDSFANIWSKITETLNAPEAFVPAPAAPAESQTAPQEEASQVQPSDLPQATPTDIKPPIDSPKVESSTPVEAEKEIEQVSKESQIVSSKEKIVTAEVEVAKTEIVEPAKEVSLVVGLSEPKPDVPQIPIEPVAEPLVCQMKVAPEEIKSVPEETPIKKVEEPKLSELQPEVYPVKQAPEQAKTPQAQEQQVGSSPTKSASEPQPAAVQPSVAPPQVTESVEQKQVQAPEVPSQPFEIEAPKPLVDSQPPKEEVPVKQTPPAAAESAPQSAQPATTETTSETSAPSTPTTTEAPKGVASIGGSPPSAPATPSTPSTPTSISAEAVPKTKESEVVSSAVIAPSTPTGASPKVVPKEGSPKTKVTEATPPTTPGTPPIEKTKQALTAETVIPGTPPPSEGSSTPTPPPRKTDKPKKAAAKSKK